MVPKVGGTGRTLGDHDWPATTTEGASRGTDTVTETGSVVPSTEVISPVGLKMATGGVDDTRMPARKEEPSAVAPGPYDDASLIRLLRELPDVVIVVGGSGRVLWGNATGERLFGRSLDSAVGMSGLELVHPEDLELVLRSLGSIQAKIVGTPIEIRLNTAGGWRLMELVGAPVPWFEEGSVLLSLRDLTDRRRFEIAHDRDGRFRSLVQNAAVVTMLVEPNGIITSCSGSGDPDAGTRPRAGGGPTTAPPGQ